MKTILFFCTDHFELYKIFEGAFASNKDYEVTTILYKKFNYKNIFQRFHNFFSKLLLGENLKSLFASQTIIDSIPGDKVYDYILVICPDFFHEKHFPVLNKIGKETIVYYWDGFDHFPQYKESLAYFDKRFSFDPKDVKKYNLTFITNFYFIEDRNTNPKTDLFFLSSYDNRFSTIDKIAVCLEKQNQKVIIIQHIKDVNTAEKPISKSIRFINEYIPFSETTQYMKDTKIVLDIHKEIQHGLSFRVFEAMGLGKKLITTNEDIVNYDFYNPVNIFVWQKDTQSIPKSFLNSSYQELPEEIYKKYNQKNWVKQLLK